MLVPKLALEYDMQSCWKCYATVGCGSKRFFDWFKSFVAPGFVRRDTKCEKKKKKSAFTWSRLQYMLPTQTQERVRTSRYLVQWPIWRASGCCRLCDRWSGCLLKQTYLSTNELTSSLHETVRALPRPAATGRRSGQFALKFCCARIII